MHRLLNRALNFAVLPRKLDITQILVDFNRFARSAIWQEYWHERESENQLNKPIFKKKKNNLPKNHTTPAGLKTFLNSIKSEIMDPRNRDEAKCNLEPDELEALTKLIQLQRERKIIIKAADKGAGIVIVNFEDYMKSCYNHLLTSLPNQNSEEAPKMSYSPVNEFALEDAKTKIIEVLDEALEANIISREEYTEKNPDNKDPAKFYCNYKVHNTNVEDNIPPVRPIISGSGSKSKNISIYLDYIYRKKT